MINNINNLHFHEKTKKKLVKTGIVWHFCQSVWLNDKQLDSLICSCTQSFEIAHHVVYGTFYNDELDVTEEVVSLLVL